MDVGGEDAKEPVDVGGGDAKEPLDIGMVIGVGCRRRRHGGSTRRQNMVLRNLMAVAVAVGRLSERSTWLEEWPKRGD